MARNTRIYSDLDFGFNMTPTGDVARKYDENAIKQSLKNLVMTSNFERPFHSEIGCRINRLLFEPAGPMLETMLQNEIRNVINNFEPRVVLNDVVVRSNPDNNVVYVSIEFRIVNTSAPISLDLILKRTR